jgi:transcriptional regulator with GAF, ATPase, and Fis domain
MLDIPSRRRLAAIVEAANAVAPTPTAGLARGLEGDRVSVVYAYPHGFGEYLLDSAAVPEAMRPEGDAPRQESRGTVAQADGPIEWFLRFCGVERLVSARMSGPGPAARLWVGTSDAAAWTPDRFAAFTALVDRSTADLAATATPEELAERSRRLDLTADLLPALLRVLDVREVFDRLSAIARRAVPHDVLHLGLLSDDLSTVTTFARTGSGIDLDIPIAIAYPPAVVRVWNFDIVDDQQQQPLERELPLAKMGARSLLRLPIRFDDRLIGGMNLVSFAPGVYTSADVEVARRLADHVAVALSHYHAAERLAAEARRHEELRARTTNLELLDELLGALVDGGALTDVFDRVSAIARKVLSHDAAALMVRLADGRQARVYASTGVPPGLPEITDVPEELLRNPDWEHHILDDLTTFAEPRYARLADMGFRSLLRVSIRFDGRFAGGLILLAKTPAAFGPDDVPVARRIADRLAVTLARDRELEASRRASEADARAAELEARVRALTEELDARTGYRRIIGDSPEWRQVLTQATQVAATDTTVLLLGESGTGKEVVARFLHRASPRKGGPFVALNCAALPEQLLEAELFGYERGAFTGAVQTKPGQLEQAAGGTLFLDEVGEMSPSAQAKFLRVLQEREFQRLGGTRILRTDARIAAATNRDLLRAIQQGQFREDLYYRLNVFAIRLPALRDRRADILPLCDAFLGEIGRGLGRPPAGISRDAREQLVAYHWPGNVRELRNILERAAILCDGGLITADYLAFAVAAPAPPAPPPASAASAAAPAAPSSVTDLETMERAMITQALESARYNKSKAAKALGLTRHQLYIRMRKYGVE